MTYRELIELYKKSKLDPEQKEKVENDIERQEAISEYLFDKDDISDLLNIKNDIEPENNIYKDENSQEEIHFTKMIHSSIRNAFIKMGIIVFIVVIFVVLSVIFILPQLVDNFYYDPSEIIGKEDNEEEGYSETTALLSMELSVYGELFIPCCNYSGAVDITDNGYGDYDINIIQTYSRTDSMTNLSGTIKKGNLTLYNTNLFSRPALGIFATAYAGVTNLSLDEDSFNTYDDCLSFIDELNDSDYYITYVTLSEVMTYSEFVSWCETNSDTVTPQWCAICSAGEPEYTYYTSDYLIGFQFSITDTYYMIYDDDTYPYLTQYDLYDSYDGDYTDEDTMTTHVLSMISFLNDNPNFYLMMGNIDYDSDDGYYTDLAEDIENNGLNIYGFAVIAQKDEISAISELDDISYITTTKAN